MRRRGLLLVIALFLILISAAGLGVAWYISQQRGGPSTNNGTPATVQEVTATPEPILNVLIAAQDLNRGQVIPTEALSSFPWPTSIVPTQAINASDPTQVALVVGARARYALVRGEPIFGSLVVRNLLQLSPSGSDAAAQIPPGSVALSIPYDKNDGVALGIQDGDHVSIIVTWSLVDLDQQFQTVLPNWTTTILPAGTSDNTVPAGGTNPYVSSVHGGPVGRTETDASTGLDFYLIPSEAQRPRLVTQSIIQDALVLHLGDFGASVFPSSEPPTPTVGPNTPPPPVPPPTNTPIPPAIITLVVSPQDALVLNYVARLMEKYPDTVQVTLALRSAGDASTTETESVTLQYMFERFNIALPAALPYGPGGSPVAPTP
jgi:pilus assembly protein CpaB